MYRITTVTIISVLLVAISFNAQVFAVESKVTVTQPRITDLSGNPLTSPVKAGQEILFLTNITNTQNKDQPFAYVLQIKNGVGVTVSLSWMTSTLSAGQSTGLIGLGWTPTYSGMYAAQILFWEGINNPIQLSSPFTIPFQVVGGQHHSYQTTSVTLSGAVNPPFRNNNVILEIYNPNNNIIQISHAPVGTDGKFSTNIIAGGPLFTMTGTYNVQVYYFGAKQNSLSFTCSSLSPISCIAN